MSKRLLIILTAVTMTTFSLALLAHERQSEVPTGGTELPQASRANQLETKAGILSTASHPALDVQRAYSKQEYTLLRQRYNANQPQARRAVGK